MKYEEIPLLNALDFPMDVDNEICDHGELSTHCSNIVTRIDPGNFPVFWNWLVEQGVILGIGDSQWVAWLGT